MHYNVKLADHEINVELSRSAQNRLAEEDVGLYAEMELYFSCLIRKKVRFHRSEPQSEVAYLDDKLGISFRPVMTKACGNDYEGDEPPLTDFPIHDARHFIPKWLRIDYRHGQWQGEFGFANP